MRSALSGLRVVELADDIAGGYCGKLFADLGADVVKVEPPGGGELRHRGEAPPDRDGLFRGGAFLHLNTNKRSTVYDRGDDQALRKLTTLVEQADLVIESSGRGDLRSWSITWDALHQRARRCPS